MSTIINETRIAKFTCTPTYSDGEEAIDSPGQKVEERGCERPMERAVVVVGWWGGVGWGGVEGGGRGNGRGTKLMRSEPQLDQGRSSARGTPEFGTWDAAGLGVTTGCRGTQASSVLSRAAGQCRRSIDPGR